MSNNLEQDKILVDTDILIDYSKKKNKILEDLLVRQSKGEIVLFTNAVIIAEFFTDKNLDDKVRYKKAEDFFRLFSLIAMTKEMGLTAGEILRERRLPFVGDALIAATCLVKSLKLATRNKRHFSKVSGLQFV